MIKGEARIQTHPSFAALLGFGTKPGSSGCEDLEAEVPSSRLRAKSRLEASRARSKVAIRLVIQSKIFLSKLLTRNITKAKKKNAEREGAKEQKHVPAKGAKGRGRGGAFVCIHHPKPPCSQKPSASASPLIRESSQSRSQTLFAKSRRGCESGCVADAVGF